MKNILILVQVSILLLLFVQSADSQPLSGQQDPVSELYQLSREYIEDYYSLYRFYQIDNAPERRERFQRFNKEYMSRLDKYAFDQLSTGGKVDYLLIKKELENNLTELQAEADEYDRLKRWVDFGTPLYELEKQRRRGKYLDAAKVADQLHDIGIELQNKTNELKKGNYTFSNALARRGEGIIEGQRKALGSVNDFYKDYDPQFTWWVAKPYEALDGMLEGYAHLLRSQVDSLSMPDDDGSGIIGNPIGRDEIIRRLQNQMIPYTPQELVDIALKEFAWCQKELLKASNEMGFGDDWKAAQEKVKQTYVEVGHQPEAMYELYKESVDFLKDNDLITVPPLAEETWRMTMLSPERQLIAPFFLGGEVLQIAYPTSGMEHEDKVMSLRGNNPHFAKAVVHHELIAGHHLQQFMNRRFKSHRFFRTPFWTEGWALYWEMVLWDQGFAKSPEDRIGMLFWRMHRCARIIFSLNYHLGEWTPQQCIDYLVDRVGHERATAEGEVRRSFTGNYGPLYQIAYMVGGLQFYKLKEELVDSGKMSFKTFHDAVIRENSMPVEMVRALLTDQSLKKDFKSNWKFYDK